jgi:HSP20 family protein
MNSLSRWQRPDLSSWPTFGRLSTLRDEIDRLFELPFGDWVRGPQVLSGWTPAMDVFEDRENFYVKAELPGMKKEDINISLHNGALSISGERKSETTHKDSESHRTERFFGRFQRSVSLPSAVAADKVKAQYKDGVLTVTLPKTEEAKPKQIDVNVS